VSFSDLVRPNFRREDERKRNSGVANDEAQAEYEAKLKESQEKEGTRTSLPV